MVGNADPCQNLWVVTLRLFGRSRTPHFATARRLEHVIKHVLGICVTKHVHIQQPKRCKNICSRLLCDWIVHFSFEEVANSVTSRAQILRFYQNTTSGISTWTRRNAGLRPLAQPPFSLKEVCASDLKHVNKRLKRFLRKGLLFGPWPAKSTQPAA